MFANQETVAAVELYIKHHVPPVVLISSASASSVDPRVAVKEPFHYTHSENLIPFNEIMRYKIYDNCLFLRHRLHLLTLFIIIFLLNSRSRKLVEVSIAQDRDKILD